MSRDEIGPKYQYDLGSAPNSVRSLILSSIHNFFRKHTLFGDLRTHVPRCNLVEEIRLEDKYAYDLLLHFALESTVIRSMNGFSDKANFIWGVPDLISDTFKRGKYQDVILPFTVLRRIDCVLEPTRDAVVEAYETFGKRLDNPTDLLCSKSGYAFYNISPFTCERLLQEQEIVRKIYDSCLGCCSPLSSFH
jgi:hypothetical protein